MNKLNLSYVPLQDLVKEIENRATALILVVVTPVDGEPSKQTIQDLSKGDPLTCIGLGEHARALARRHYEAQTGKSI